MGKNVDAKTIFLLLVIIILVSIAGYLTYMISNDEDPLVLLSSRASEDDFDFSITDDAGGGTDPTPTYASTSPSPSPEPTLPEGENPSPTIIVATAPPQQPTDSVEASTPVPTAQLSPDIVYVTATPIPSQLPQAGVFNFIQPVFFGVVVLLGVIFLI